MLTDVHNKNDILTVLYKFEAIYASKIAMKAGMPILGWNYHRGYMRCTEVRTVKQMQTYGLHDSLEL